MILLSQLFAISMVLELFTGLTGLTVSVIDLVLGNPQLVGAALGLLTPLLVEVIKQPGLSKARQKFLAYGVAGLIGVLTVIASGQFNAADLSSTILIVIAVSQATYADLWKDAGATRAIAVRTVRQKFKPRE